MKLQTEESMNSAETDRRCCWKYGGGVVEFGRDEVTLLVRKLTLYLDR